MESLLIVSFVEIIAGKLSGCELLTCSHQQVLSRTKEYYSLVALLYVKMFDD